MLCNKMELAKFLWERVDHTICYAVIGACLCEGLYNSVEPHETHLRSVYQENKKQFEQWAVQVSKIETAQPNGHQTVL